MTLSNLDILNSNKNTFDTLMTGERINREITGFFNKSIMQAKAEGSKNLKEVRLESIAELMAKAKESGALQTMLLAIRLKNVVDNDVLNNALKLYVKEVNAEIDLIQFNDLNVFARVYTRLEKAYREVTEKNDEQLSSMNRKFSSSDTDIDIAMFDPADTPATDVKVKRSGSESDISDTEEVSGPEMYAFRELTEIAKAQDSAQLNRDMTNLMVQKHALNSIYALYVMQDEELGAEAASLRINDLKDDLYGNKGKFSDFFRSIKKAAGFDKELLHKLKSTLVLQIAEQGGFSEQQFAEMFEVIGWDILDKYGELDHSKSNFKKALEEVKQFISNQISEGNTIGLKLLMQIKYFKNFVSQVADDFADDARENTDVSNILLASIVDNSYDFKMPENGEIEYNEYVSLHTMLSGMYKKFDVPKSYLNVVLLQKALESGSDLELRTLSEINKWESVDVVKQLIANGLFTEEILRKALESDYFKFLDIEVFAKALAECGTDEQMSVYMNVSETKAIDVFASLTISEEGTLDNFNKMLSMTSLMQGLGDQAEKVFCAIEASLEIAGNQVRHNAMNSVDTALYTNYRDNGDADEDIDSFLNYVVFLNASEGGINSLDLLEYLKHLAEFYGKEGHTGIIELKIIKEKVEAAVRKGDLEEVGSLMEQPGYREGIARDSAHYIQFVANNNPDEEFLGKLGITNPKVLWEVLDKFAAEDNKFMVQFMTEKDILFGTTNSYIYERIMKKAAEAGASEVFFATWGKSSFALGDLVTRGIYDKMNEDLREAVSAHIEKFDANPKAANGLDSPAVWDADDDTTAFIVPQSMIIAEDEEFSDKTPAGFASPLDRLESGQNYVNASAAPNKFFGADFEYDKAEYERWKKEDAISFDEMAPLSSAYDGFATPASAISLSGSTKTVLRKGSDASEYDRFSEVFSDGEDGAVFVGNFDEHAGITSPKVINFGTFSTGSITEDPTFFADDEDDTDDEVGGGRTTSGSADSMDGSEIEFTLPARTNPFHTERRSSESGVDTDDSANSPENVRKVVKIKKIPSPLELVDSAVDDTSDDDGSPGGYTKVFIPKKKAADLLSPAESINGFPDTPKDNGGVTLAGENGEDFTAVTVM